MRAVLEKTQELAEAILESECYQKMKRLEGETRRDEEAASLLDDMIWKRKHVEDILSDVNMNPEELKKASAEMSKAEAAMNANARIQELKAARKEVQQMMENVNQLLRLVLTGSISGNSTDDFFISSGFAGASRGGCGGNCGQCAGCE